MDLPKTTDQIDTSIELIDYKHLNFIDAFNMIYIQMQEFYARFGLEMNSSIIKDFLSRYYPGLELDNRPLYLQLVKPENHEIFLDA
jgi:hypothetical protein